jgi:hypothetical protein
VGKQRVVLRHVSEAPLFDGDIDAERRIEQNGISDCDARSLARKNAQEQCQR